MGPTGSRNKLMGDINVTPFVDVMLVLLIIFMVTAPMMTQGLEVDLPETTPTPLAQREEPLVVTINKNSEFFLGEEKLGVIELKRRFGAMTPEQKKEGIYLRADKNVPYGTVAMMMADIKASGFGKIGMITIPLEEKL